MIPVLLYHQVLECNGSLEPSSISYGIGKDNFEKQLRLIKRLGYRSISLSDYVDSILYRRPLSPKTVVLTFDDGYSDLLLVVQPLLENYSFHATVFLLPGLMDFKDSQSVSGERLLTWYEVKQLNPNCFSFGSHSNTHLDFTAITNAEIIEQVTDSKRIIESNLLVNVDLFSYPYGRATSAMYPVLKKAGYKAACGVDRTPWDVYNIWRMEGSKIKSSLSLGFSLLCAPYIFYKFREEYRVGVHARKIYCLLKRSVT